MGYLEHLDREWAIRGWPKEEIPEPADDASDEDKEAYFSIGMQALVYQNVRQLIETFGEQGHSGTSAPYVTRMFGKVALFKPLSPLTGADSEWRPSLNGGFQNVRASHVFKDKDGIAFDSRAITFRHPDGACFTSSDSRREVTFPYTPSTLYVDVDKDGNAEPGEEA